MFQQNEIYGGIRMKRYVDLHIHSCDSDSTMTPEEIMAEIKRQGVKLCSITDHNILKAGFYDPDGDVTVLPGAEIDAIYDGVNIHILGFGCDVDNENLQELCRNTREIMEDTNRHLIHQLAQEFPQINEEEYEDYTYDRRLGGWKTLHYMIEKGLAKNTDECFPYYVRYGNLYNQTPFETAEVVIHAIHDARGKALLAHGGYTFRQRIDEEIVEVVKGLQALGLDGAECYYPLHTKSQQEKLLAYCRKEGLLISAGNDCHGTFQPETINQIKVCEDQISCDALKALLQ